MRLLAATRESVLWRFPPIASPSATLRHSFASFLVNEGVSLYVVQALLGHANARTTQRYAHLASDTLTDATEIVDGIVAAQPRVVTPAAVEEMASW